MHQLHRNEAISLTQFWKAVVRSFQFKSRTFQKPKLSQTKAEAMLVRILLLEDLLRKPFFPSPQQIPYLWKQRSNLFLVPLNTNGMTSVINKHFNDKKTFHLVRQQPQHSPTPSVHTCWCSRGWCHLVQSEFSTAALVLLLTSSISCFQGQKCHRRQTKPKTIPCPQSRSYKLSYLSGQLPYIK